MTSDSSCNHYVTHPSSFSLSRFSPGLVRLNRYSTPPLSRPRYRSPSRGNGSITLTTPLTILFSSRFPFPPVRHFVPKRSHPLASSLSPLGAALGYYFIPWDWYPLSADFPFSPRRSSSNFRSDPLRQNGHGNRASYQLEIVARAPFESWKLKGGISYKRPYALYR